MNTSARNGLLALGLLVIVGVVGGAYLHYRSTQGETAVVENGQVAGTVDYDSVPAGTPETGDVKLNEEKQILGVRITPAEVVEDSRCPTGVQCIQAGTVRVRAMVAERGGSGAAEAYMFELGVPMSVGMDQVTLVAVKPDVQSASMEIADGDYVFTFTVVKEGGSEMFKG